jgi:hypothetical protein
MRSCMLVLLPVALLGCEEEPKGGGGPVSGPEGPEVPIVPLELAGPDCTDLVEATFVEGGQGGFHAELGVLVQTPTPEVALTMTVRDPESGDVLASSGENFVGLVGWTEDDPVGWITKETFIGDGQGSLGTTALACALRDRRLVEVEAVVRDLVTEESGTISAQLTTWFTDPRGRCD